MAIYDDKIARYEDSHQVHSVNIVGWKPVTTMKKLEHNLYLTIDGPDENKARSCVEQAAGAGLLAATAAAFIGAGIGAAEVGFMAGKAAIVACLGDGFDIRLRDESHWVYWEL